MLMLGLPEVWTPRAPGNLYANENPF